MLLRLLEPRSGGLTGAHWQVWTCPSEATRHRPKGGGQRTKWTNRWLVLTNVNVPFSPETRCVGP